MTAHPTAPEVPKPVISRRSVVIGVIVGFPLSLLFLWLAVRGVDFDAVATALGDARVGLVLLAVLAMAIVYVIQAERWRFIARRDGTAPLSVFTAMVVGSVAINNVVPGRPGELVRAYWLSRRTSMPGGRALATVIVDRASDVVALVVILAITLPFIDHPPWLQTIVYVVLPLAVLLVALMVAAWWYTHRSATGRARGVPGAVERSRFRRHLSEIVRGAASIVTAKDAMVVAGLSLLAWTVWAGGAWAVAASLGIPQSALDMLFVTAVLNLGVAIPSSPGFVGTYQWLAVAAMGLTGVSRDNAFAFSVLMQATWLIPTTLVGVGLAAWAGITGIDLRTLTRRTSGPKENHAA
jgi:uncharacterized protein (TIRG00374 family)